MRTDDVPRCVVVGSTVTTLCGGMNAQAMCQLDINMNLEAIPSKHLSFSGTLTTTNIIMANWSRQMWQDVVNRAVRMLASGPLASHFFSAFATVA
ncbi:hypothetical protein KIN20_023567 [Parelaphostrongylus tenuis]|uniref:Uncharacterized protein n=1 Tax=Parelaphostrongylus tenuis TaxID=148309 RepID=A0AAD5N7A0_PARTN|nr:hypothetical protein KIN20_023567 [Parelaphostrongylus tenuis]